MLSCVCATSRAGVPLHLPFGHIPFRVTTLLWKQVGESASPRLDADDRMAYSAGSIKASSLLALDLGP